MAPARTKNETLLPAFSSSLRVVLRGKRTPSVVSRDQTVAAATDKLAKAIARPGVNPDVVFVSSKVPSFSAHPTKPGLLIRSFKSGRREVVRVDSRGRFTVVE